MPSLLPSPDTPIRPLIFTKNDFHKKFLCMPLTFACAGVLSSKRRLPAVHTDLGSQQAPIWRRLCPKENGISFGQTECHAWCRRPCRSKSNRAEKQPVHPCTQRRQPKVKNRLNSMLVLFAAIAILSCASPVRAQYLGDAYGLNLNLDALNLLSLGVTIADTGALPSAGGDHLPSTSLPLRQAPEGSAAWAPPRASSIPAHRESAVSSTARPSSIT